MDWAKIAVSTRAASWLATGMFLAMIGSGCGSKTPSAKMTAEQLERSFEKTEVSLAQEVTKASSAFQTSNYEQAILIMDRVVQSRAMDEHQKKAVDALIIHTRQAVEQNPKLNTPQLYQALSDLFIKVHGEN
jgi:hypothetical protein